MYQIDGVFFGEGQDGFDDGASAGGWATGATGRLSDGHELPSEQRQVVGVARQRMRVDDGEFGFQRRDVDFVQFGHGHDAESSQGVVA